jgi:cytochrome c-type biogenesis protein CcmH/NrfG
MKRFINCKMILKSDPKNVNALFNLGMIRYKGKNDAAGAISAWRELLKNNPNLDRKPVDEKMIAEAQAAGAAGKLKLRGIQEGERQRDRNQNDNK